MNLEYLRTFLDVVRSGSFSEVAKKLSISQPAVSFQIQKLEHDLGLRLIDRGQKGVILTEAGKRLLIFSEYVEKERQQLEYDLAQMSDEVTGNLLVVASTIPGEYLLPIILGDFKSLHPAIETTVVVSDSLTSISGVRNGTYNVGFCGVLLNGTDLESFKIAEDEIVLIVFPEHPFAQRQVISITELEKEPLIVRERESGTQQKLESFMFERGVDVRQWKPKLVLSTTQALVSAVEAKVGIAFVSNIAIKRSLSLNLVKVVNIEDMKLRRDFYCIYRKERVVSRLLSEFIAYVQAKASHV